MGDTSWAGIRRPGILFFFYTAASQEAAGRTPTLPSSKNLRQFTLYSSATYNNT